MSAWQTGHVVGGSESAMEPHSGQTRLSQQAGSPGRSSSSGDRTPSRCGSPIISVLSDRENSPSHTSQPPPSVLNSGCARIEARTATTRRDTPAPRTYRRPSAFSGGAGGGLFAARPYTDIRGYERKEHSHAIHSRVCPSNCRYGGDVWSRADGHGSGHSCPGCSPFLHRSLSPDQPGRIDRPGQR